MSNSQRLVRPDGSIIEYETQDRVVADGRVWVRVKGSRPWKPKFIGDAFVGQFISKSTRPGDNGSVYGVCTFRAEDGRMFTVSGVVITGLVEAAGIDSGCMVRVVFLGEETSTAGRTYRKFDLFVEMTR